MTEPSSFTDPDGAAAPLTTPHSDQLEYYTNVITAHAPLFGTQQWPEPPVQH
jgi:hypothetical protein